MFMNMNQSIFGLIAAAGSRVDFNDRFDENSSSDEDQEGDNKKGRGKKSWREDLSQTTILQPKKSDMAQKGSQRRRISGSKLLKSLPALPKLKAKSKSSPAQLPPQPEEESDEADESGDSGSPTSQPVPPVIKLTRENTLNGEQPVLSRMLEAQAEMESRSSFDLGPEDVARSGLGTGDDATPLARRLMEIFEFEEPEQVIGEYPCWLLQSVLLQGYLYVTAKHICFYAYLPKKAVGLLTIYAAPECWLTCASRMSSPSLVIFPRVGSGIPNTTASGSD
jgi:sterol 3beta-glucosyltransferase